MRALVCLRYLLAGSILATAGCSYLDAKVDSQLLAATNGNQIKKLAVVEDAPKLGSCKQESPLFYDKDQSIMSFFNDSFKEKLGKCGVIVAFSSGSNYELPAVQNEVRDGTPDAVLIIRSKSAANSQTYVGGVSGNSAVMKASFDLSLLDVSGKKMWGAQSSFDRTPDLMTVYNTSTCEGTGTRFSSAIIKAMNRDGIITCSIAEDNQ